MAQTQATPSKILGEQLQRALLLDGTEFDDSFTGGAALLPEPMLTANHKLPEGFYKFKGLYLKFPLLQKLWSAYKNAEAKFWSAEEIEFGEDSDAKDWESLPGNQRACIMHALAAMCVNDEVGNGEPVFQRLSDEIQVESNLFKKQIPRSGSDFRDTLQVPEVRCFFGFIGMMENIHLEAQDVLLGLFSGTDEKKEYIVDALGEMPTISKRVAWIQKHISESPCSYATRTFALAAYFSIFNIAAQSILLHVCISQSEPQKNKFNGLKRSIVKVQADRHRCVQFLRLLACDHLVNPIDQNEAISIVNEALAIEREAASECFEMAGAGLGKLGVLEVAGETVRADAVARRCQRIGSSLLKTFGFKTNIQAASGKKEDSLEWMDSLLWKLVNADSGISEQTQAIEKKEVAQEKVNAKEEFSLEEDF
ncbi:Ribonucleoside-diphosphate reductase subunit M2 [Entophlyctis luteolus]|nr:Ribonucleoside-diphosphate reductase subunit M2 [Entophlyctis luteolus]